MWLVDLVWQPWRLSKIRSKAATGTAAFQLQMIKPEHINHSSCLNCAAMASNWYTSILWPNYPSHGICAPSSVQASPGNL